MFFGGEQGGQVELDAYFNNPSEATLAPLRNALYQFGHQYVCTPDYERMVVEAVRSGIRVIGIDAHPCNRGLASEAWAATIEGVLGSDQSARVAGYGGIHHMGYHRFLGEMSGDEFPTVDRILGDRGIYGPVVHFIGGTTLDVWDEDVDLPTKAVIGAEMSHQRFMFGVERPRPEDVEAMSSNYDRKSWPDIFIHTPIHDAPVIEGQEDFPIRRRQNLGTLGLPGDARWIARWNQFMRYG